MRFVVSTKAKSRIKDLLREAERKIAREGKELLAKKLKQVKLEPETATIDQLRNFLNEPTISSLYYKVGKGIITINEVRRFREFKISGPHKSKVTDPVITEPENHPATKKKYDDILLIGEDMDVVEYKLAKCCTPIPGDEVFGFFSSDAQILIHRVNCSNAIKLLSNYAYRIVRAKWGNDQLISFLAGIRISGNDEIGMVNTITKIISNENNVNMRSIHFDTDDGLFEGTLMVYVHDTKHLNHLVQNLKKIKGVRMVERVGP